MVIYRFIKKITLKIVLYGSNVPLKSFVSQGSTRSEVDKLTYNLEDEIYLSSIICTNPNSMSLEDAKRFEKIYNEERIKEGKKP